MKKIYAFILLFLLATSVSLPSHAGVQQNVSFQGWVGKRQKDQINDYSGWHACYSNRGGSCGSRSLTTGSSRCTSWGVGFGLDFEPKYKQFSGLKIKTGGTRTWSSCTTRSETVTCSPNVGYKGRSEIVTTARWGKMRVAGVKNYNNERQYYKNQCKTGYRETFNGTFRCGAKGSSTCQRRTCTKTVHNREAYWPEKKWSRCRYVRG